MRREGRLPNRATARAAFPMNRSAGSKAARANGYGSLKGFRAAASSNAYRFAAGAYERKHNLAAGSAMRPTSVFARLYGKAFYKDGKLRATKDIPHSYLKRV